MKKPFHFKAKAYKNNSNMTVEIERLMADYLKDDPKPKVEMRDMSTPPVAQDGWKRFHN